MSLMNSTRIGAWRDIAPLECMLIALTQEGSGGAVRDFAERAESLLQLADKSRTAETTRAARRGRIMKAPEAVSRSLS